MLSRQRQIQVQLQKILDASLFGLSWWLAWFFRNSEFGYTLIQQFGGTLTIYDFAAYKWVLIPSVLLAPLALETQGFYARPRICSRGLTVLSLARACCLAVIMLILIFYFAGDAAQVARGVVVYFGVISFCLLLLKEELRQQGLLRGLGSARNRRKLIIVGAKSDTEEFRDRLLARAQEKVEIQGYLDLNQASVEDLVKRLHDHSINGVVISAKHTYFGQIEKAIQACELEGVEVWLLADFFKTQISRTSVDDLLGHPMMVFQSAPEASWQGVAKSLLDFVGGVILLTLLAPLFFALALAIRMTSPGPIFFKQRRSGLNGEPFTMLKFRSMVSDAEQLKGELEALNEMSGPVFKVSDDPRITPIGRFLRKYSLDELPQLLNVVRGEMSLVGPRPLPVDEVMRFHDFAHRRRLSVKPGLTCLWQISGRNNVTDFKAWVALDLEYIDNWSFWLDLKILFRTIPVVLAGTGAK